jgi:hypothetical protein
LLKGKNLLQNSIPVKIYPGQLPLASPCKKSYVKRKSKEKDKKTKKPKTKSPCGKSLQ